MATKSAHVVDVSDTNFEQIVLQESLNRPVIVDFWATWCEPCRTLGPLLEDLADEYAGAFLLAKVDVDRNQAVAGAARIQSIPTVVAVHGGSFVDQFIGALPKPDVKRFVDNVLARAGIAGPPKASKVPTQPEDAVRHWQRHVEKNPDDAAALLEIGRLLLRLQRLDDARETLERIPANTPEYNDAQASLKVMGLLTEVGDEGGPETVRARLAENPDDKRAAYLVACADAAQGRFLPALDTLIDLVANGTADLRPDAKRAATTILQATGRDDDAIEELRRRLARLLF